jgi:cyclopropane-fatty-acyl-phospholipid synthase
MNMKKKGHSALSTNGPHYDENFLGIPALAPDPASSVMALDRWLTRSLLAAIGNPAVSFVLWNGEAVTADGVNPVEKLLIRDRRALLQLLINPEFNFGDLYCNSRLEVTGSLAGFLHRVYLSRQRGRDNQVIKLFNTLSNYYRRSGSSHSRKNIHHHYDIGNEFYRLWLDREVMQYTCAYFPEPDLTLEQAQVAKLHHVCRKLQLKPGESVVEAGCGWGGLALFMAREYGVNVTACNISHEQIIYARELAQRRGLAGRVTFIEDDYRNIHGKYDAFVSVGMLEHVGTENYRDLGRLIDQCIGKKTGRGLIHTIGRNRPMSMNPWIEARIFPGGYPPSLSEMMQIFESVPFSVLDIENLRLHYARTLEHWLQRYEQNVDIVTKMYDRLFVRAWRLYLCGSVAAFTSGQMQLFQVLFTRPLNNRLPWSRAHLYH